MKKLNAIVIAAAMFTVFTLHPVGSEASSLSEINKDINKVNSEIRDAEHEAAHTSEQIKLTEKEMKELRARTDKLEKEIKQLMADINKVVAQKVDTEGKKVAKQEEIDQTGIELNEAIQRVEERDAMLQKRMKIMYTNGAVSYLEVLLSAKSFTDFLDRFDALQTILSSDRKILDEHKRDQKLVEEKKAEQESQYAELQELVYELELQEADLHDKEKDKEVMMASYNDNLKKLGETLEELEQISEDQEKMLLDLAGKKSKLIAEKNRIQNPYTGGKLGMPIGKNYRVTSSFGMRVHPITGKKKQHTGTDFGAPSGTAILAAEDGIVLVSKFMDGYGNVIIIDHGNGLWTLYAHIRHGGLLVEEGDAVKRGDQIAEVGNTGNSTGPHLHFEVRKDQVPVNPGGYLK
ncbi:peptidoglycan DD-metalloendopeptidase family protein [Paenibacillus sp. J5C_2022]|uniref:murein hydrolase activator EnvC family protein n=1 Tax=Paenibacillus sp. J5C2022 TaxID=2977129 RepID=UPI0021D0CFD9|nr:peptidoglycan DD-metalloendopeptidase family protein [Paenibacillus sp. J5C2022]MCU6708394.1 peptidoglycan DD-metalloendopeptidase family protein [Paenibacillus sp. J5C2022]